MIQNHYLANYAAGRLVEPEYRIPGASKKRTGNPGYADIADLTLRQLYEIKPVATEAKGQADLAWYLGFLPGWTPGAVYPQAPTRIGPWPGDPTRDVYARMRVPGVIVYWGRSSRRLAPDPLPVPVPIPEPQNSRGRSWQWSTQPVVVTCGMVIVVGATVVILLNPVPGDELLLPGLWAPLLVP